ncbi:hypothetical protein HN385_08405 [archaeon]|nr:hypothetical protein [archaeon]MBT7558313.1 hypothetical protein [Candidatus Woesearchaeota archaeon]
MSIKKSTRQKLRDAANRNGLGGVHYYDKICDSCGKDYVAKASNQLLCYECKKIGRLKECEHCDSRFHTKNNGKYCNQCVGNRVWMRKRDNIKIAKKIQHTKKKWLQSDEAKQFYTQLGKHNSKKMKEFNQTEKGKANIKRNAKLNSKLMREKISNGEFTPPITNTFTHWDAIIEVNGKVKKFRNSWEACFWYSNQHLEYESKECRTKKTDNGRVYMGDFYDKDTKILYEIKPRSFFLKQTKKIDSLIKHCDVSGYKFKWINENNIMDYINSEIFIDNNKIQLNKMYVGIGYSEQDKD